MLSAIMLPLYVQAQQNGLNETFENVTSGGIPDGWNVTDSINGRVQWEVYNGGANGSNRCFYFDCYDARDYEYCMAKTPEIAVQQGYVLSFDYKNPGGGEFRVLISYDGGKSFETNPVVGNLGNDVMDWESFMYELPYKTNNIVLGFMAVGSYSDMRSMSIYLDNVKVGAPPQCAQPSGLMVSGIKSTSATLTWTMGTVGGVSNVFNVVVTKDGETVKEESITTDMSVGNLYEITGLQPNTKYDVKLQTDCSAAYKGLSEWSKTVSFTTSCESVELPQTYTFDDWTGVSECWTVQPADDYVEYGPSDREYMGSDGQSFMIYGDAYVFTEPIAHAANDMEISFWVYNSNYRGNAELKIGQQSDMAASDTYVLLQTVNVQPRQWTQVVIYTDGSAHAATENTYIVFSTENLNYQLYLDDLTIKTLPTCLRPNDVKVSKIGDTEMSFEWKGTPGCNLEVYNSENGQEPVLLGTVTSAANTLGNLTSDKEYNLSFKANCGGEQSDWSLDNITIRTACAPLSLSDGDVSCNFDDGSLPECWRIEDYELSWRISGNEQYSGLYSLQSEYAQGRSLLILPYMNIPEENAYQVDLYMFGDGYNYSSDDMSILNIYVNENTPDTAGAILLKSLYRGTTWEPVVPQEGWNEYMADIPVKGDVYVILEVISDYGENIYIDDLRVRKIPSCLKPKNFEVKSVGDDNAVIGWTAGGSETEWYVEYVYEGLETPITTENTDAPQVTISGLTANTDYTVDLKVVAHCSADDVSDTLKSSVNFTTSCGTINIEETGSYTEDFSGNGWNCWTILETYTKEGWGGTFTKYPYVGSYDELTMQGDELTGNMFAMPSFDYENVGDWRVQFDYVSDDGCTLEVGVMRDLNDSRSFQSIAAIEGTSENKHYKVNLDSYSGYGYIVFKYTSTSYDYGSTLDNVTVDRIPTCPDIEAVKIDSIYDVKVDLTVTCGDVTAFEVVYGEPRCNPNELAMEPIYKEGTTFTIDGLSGDTDYDLYVRAVCGEERGAWCDEPVSFHTQCEHKEIVQGTPFTDGFEDYGSYDMGCWKSLPVAGVAIWESRSSSYDSYEGRRYFSLAGDYGVAAEADLYYPVLLKAGVQYEIEFYVKVDNNFSGSEIEVALSNTVDPQDLTAVTIITRPVDNREWQEVRRFFTPATDVKFLRIRGTTVGGIYDLGLDALTLKCVPCKYPEEISVMQLTETGARLMWETGAAKWNVKVSTTEIDPATTDGDIYDGTSDVNYIDLTALTGNTTYYCYLQALCDDGTESEWTRLYTFKTLCAAEHIPYSESFEDESIMECWLTAGEGSCEISTFQVMDGVYSCEMSTEASVSLITPTLEVESLSSYMFKMHVFSLTDSARLVIGVMTDPSDMGTVAPVAEVVIPDVREWTEVIAYFSTLEGAALDAKNIYITTSNSIVYIDNVSVSEPPSCPKAGALSIKELGTDNITIEWMTNTAPERQWTVKLVAKESGEVKEYTGQTSPMKIDGLVPNRDYVIELFAVCGDNVYGDTTAMLFRTACGVEALPFSENFDAVYDMGQRLPSCWNDAIKQGSTSSYNTWETVNSGNYKCVEFDAYYNAKGNQCMLQTPVIDLTDAEGAEISFTMQNKSADLHIVVSTDGGISFEDTVAKNIKSEEWAEVQYDLTEFCGNEIIIGFAAISDGSYNSKIYIDNVYVSLPPTCPKSANMSLTEVSDTAVKLSIIDESDAEMWEIAVGETGFNPDTVKNPHGFTEKNAVVNSLQPITTYEAYIRTVCGENDQSPWSAFPIVFTTECAAEKIPYDETFEEYDDATEIKCISFESIGYVNLSVVSTSYYLLDGKRSLRIAGSGESSFFVLPEIDADIEGLMLSFLYQIPYSGVYVNVGVIHKDSIQEIDNMFRPVATLTKTQSIETAKIKFNNAGVTGRDYRIVINECNSSYSGELLIDNIHVDEIPTFFSPEDLHVKAVTETSATLVWTQSPDAEGSELMIDGDESSVIEEITTGEKTLTELTPNTEYKVQIRDYKTTDGQKEYTEWCDPLTFRTSQVPVTMPFICSFEQQEADDWTMIASENASWIVSGKDKSAVYEGEQALYVADADSMNVYNCAHGNMVYAYRTVNLEEKLYRLSFMYHIDQSQNAWADDYFKVFLIPSYYDIVAVGTELPEDGIAISEKLKNKPEWTLFSGDADVDSAGYYNLVFMWNNIANYSTEYVAAAVDSIEMKEVVCRPVTGLEVDSVRHASAIVRWTGPNVGIQYVLLEAGEVFDESTESVSDVDEGADSVRLESLLPQMSYTVYVRSNCGTDGYSDWSEPVSFTTTCVPDTVDLTHAFVEDFETYDKYGNLGCWVQTTNGDEEWTLSDKPSNRYEAYSGNKHVYLPWCDEGAWMTRNFVLKGGLSYQMMFYARVDEVSEGTRIAVGVAPEGSRQEQMKLYFDVRRLTTDYTMYTARLSVEADGTYVVGLYGEADGVYLSVDSIAIKAVECDMPAVVEVGSVTSAYAKLTWIDVADKYHIVVTGGGVEVDTIVDVSELELNGLMGSTKYRGTISSVCEDGNETSATAFEFTTLCDGATIAPVFEDFENINTLPSCWDNSEGTTDVEEYRWNFYMDETGNGMLRFDSRDNQKDKTNVLKSPAVHIDERGAVMTLDYMNPNGGEMSIYLSTDGGKSYCDTLVNKALKVNEWTTLEENLDRFAGNDVMVIIKSVSCAWYYSNAFHYIDNFRINTIGFTYNLSDTVCAGENYEGYGFSVAAGQLKEGVNQLTRKESDDKALVPDTVYNVSVYVPQQHYYFHDYIQPGETYTGYGFTNGITEPGPDYTRTEISSAGCDSVIHLRLDEVVLDVELDAEICAGDSIWFCDKWEKPIYDSVYVCTMKSVLYPELDSVTRIAVTVLPVETHVFDTICQGDKYEFGDEIYELRGLYSREYLNESGCEATEWLHLEVLDSVIIKDTVICEGVEVELEGMLYNSTGEYRIPIKNKFGCDRYIILRMEVTPRDTFDISGVACEGRPVYLDGFADITVTKDSVLYRIDTDSKGCDSVTRLSLTFVPTIHTFDTVTISQGESYPYDGETLIAAGDYESRPVMSDVTGCDSINHLHLDVVTSTGKTMVRNLVIVPNPIEAMGTAYIVADWTIRELTGMRMEIIDISGRIIYSDVITETPIVINGIHSSGLYQVRVTDGVGKVHVGKLIVK